MRTVIFRDVIDPANGKVKVIPIVLELERIEDLPSVLAEIDRRFTRNPGGHRNG